MWGCGKGNTGAPATIDPVTGKHTLAGMAVPGTGGAHLDAYFADPTGCAGCHGKPEDLSGGIVKVSCSTNTRSGMTCHAGKFPHGFGFDVPKTHGTKKAIIAAGPTSGMAFCAKCHGSSFTVVTSSGDSCISCHQRLAGSNAPHAGKWAAYLSNARGLNHSATNESNAAVCAQCHTGKMNLSPAGVARVGIFTTKGVGGCFDNTMCHNQARHALPYTSPATHGVAAAANLSSCMSSACHGNGASPLRLNKQLAGNTNIPNGCETCHIGTEANFFGPGLGLAHPPMWLQSRGTATNHSGASFGAGGTYCNPCHAITGTANGPSAPSCGTAALVGGTTRCHSSMGDPVINPSGCVSCHGNPPNSNKHAFHLPPTIPGLGCAACHGSASGPGQASHANNIINMGFNSALYGEGAGITYAAGVCSNVSCHGGKPIPAWTTGTVQNPIFLATCDNCHTLVDQTGNVGGQYINVFNGDSGSFNNLHYGHTLYGATGCTDCHSVAKLANLHFANLFNGKRPFVAGDPKAKGFAASTVGGPDTKVLNYVYSPVVGKSSCLSTGYVMSTGCHGVGDGGTNPITNVVGPDNLRSWFQ